MPTRKFPYWRIGLHPHASRPFIIEGTWGAQIIDALQPHDGEHLVIKKGFGGFANTPLDTILRTMGVTTCVVAGVTTCVCVSTTIRGGVEHNYRMILVKDAVAEITRATHEGELQTMARLFADVHTTDEVVAMLARATTAGGSLRTREAQGAGTVVSGLQASAQGLTTCRTESNTVLCVPQTRHHERDGDDPLREQT